MSTLKANRVYNTCNVKALRQDSHHDYYLEGIFMNPVLVLEVDEKAGMIRYVSKTNEERWISQHEAEEWHDITDEVGEEKLERYKNFILEHGELPPNLWGMILHLSFKWSSGDWRAVTFLGSYYCHHYQGDTTPMCWKKIGLA